MTTNKQKADVHFCEQWLNVTFTGNINNEQEVLDFLNEYFNEAARIYEEYSYEYEEAYLWNLD